MEICKKIKIMNFEREIMYYAGVDLGSAYLKCIILKEKDIVARSIYPIEGNPLNTAKTTTKEMLSQLNIKEKQVKQYVTTGRNRKKFPYRNKEMTEVLCIAKGAFDLIPTIRTIIDLGAITNKAIKLNDKGKVMEYVINDKCASGSGLFLELVAKALEMEIDELGSNATHSKNPISITNQCTIFAESEVIYLVNEGQPEIDIAAGVCNSIGGNLYSLIKRVRLEADIALTGGVANNEQIANNVEERLGMLLKKFPINPSYIAAYGAALYAREL